jgi:hypothetical protein
MEKCYDCHSLEDTRAPSGECELCHPDGFELRPGDHLVDEWLPVRPLVDEVRGEHTSADPSDLGPECRMCHLPSFCSDCHKMDMPHPGEWEQEHAPTARQVGGTSCDMCHPGKEGCMECHHAGYEPGGPSWEEIHYVAALTDGVETCIGCHSTKTCAHCHTTGQYRSYD